VTHDGPKAADDKPAKKGKGAPKEPPMVLGEWGEVSAADLGKKVKVSGYDAVGVLRFFGKHASENDDRCGVELPTPTGINNGTVRGHTYFTCPEKHGLLAHPSKVAVLVPASSKSRPAPLRGARAGALLTQPAETKAGASADEPIGEKHLNWRVLVDKLGPGVLRYFGPHAQDQGVRCGVELDSKQGKHDGMVRGHRYFQCLPEHGVLVRRAGFAA